MEDRCLGDERMPIAAEKKQPLRGVPGSSRRVKGFGPFLEKAGDHLTLKTVKKLTTYAEFGDAVYDRIKRKELPGLSFLHELDSRGKISKDNISYLSDALDFIKCRGVRAKIEELYNQHCCPDVIKNGEQVNSVSFQDGEGPVKIMKLNNTENTENELKVSADTGSRTFDKTGRKAESDIIQTPRRRKSTKQQSEVLSPSPRHTISIKHEDETGKTKMKIKYFDSMTSYCKCKKKPRMSAKKESARTTRRILCDITVNNEESE